MNKFKKIVPLWLIFFTMMQIFTSVIPYNSAFAVKSKGGTYIYETLPPPVQDYEPLIGYTYLYSPYDYFSINGKYELLETTGSNYHAQNAKFYEVSVDIDVDDGDTTQTSQTPVFTAVKIGSKYYVEYNDIKGSMEKVNVSAPDGSFNFDGELPISMIQMLAGNSTYVLNHITPISFNRRYSYEYVSSIFGHGSNQWVSLPLKDNQTYTLVDLEQFAIACGAKMTVNDRYIHINISQPPQTFMFASDDIIWQEDDGSIPGVEIYLSGNTFNRVENKGMFVSFKKTSGPNAQYETLNEIHSLTPSPPAENYSVEQGNNGLCSFFKISKIKFSGPGTYKFSFYVTDNVGRSSDPVEQEITVYKYNQPIDNDPSITKIKDVDKLIGLSNYVAPTSASPLSAPKRDRFHFSTFYFQISPAPPFMNAPAIRMVPYTIPGKTTLGVMTKVPYMSFDFWMTMKIGYVTYRFIFLRIYSFRALDYTIKNESVTLGTILGIIRAVQDSQRENRIYRAKDGREVIAKEETDDSGHTVTNYYVNTKSGLVSIEKAKIEEVYSYTKFTPSVFGKVNLTLFKVDPNFHNPWIPGGQSGVNKFNEAVSLYLNRYIDSIQLGSTNRDDVKDGKYGLYIFPILGWCPPVFSPPWPVSPANKLEVYTPLRQAYYSKANKDSIGHSMETNPLAGALVGSIMDSLQSVAQTGQISQFTKTFMNSFKNQAFGWANSQVTGGLPINVIGN
jgi:hypothetical protein